jgi:tRNA(fMet)-specific endonuclease VapC
MYMLDTNTCIFAIKGAKTKKYEHIISILNDKRADGLSVSAITLAELEFGVANSAIPEKNAVALMNFISIMDILPFDDGAAIEYGHIRAVLQKIGRPLGSLDMLIAAHAKALGHTLVTNNTREFERVPGLATEDWLFATT